MEKIRAYYILTKPGIVMGNTISNIAGFALAAKDGFSISVFLAATFGLASVIASACVFNNYIDRDIDKKMKRTAKRGLVTGEIPVANALIFGSSLLLIGMLLLSLLTTLMAAYVALFGFVAYVFIYGYAKRMSPFGTIVGSISGAVPPVVGYTAVSGRLDAAAGVLFLLLVLWQMPHFYAIAMFRAKEYMSASIPVLPAVKGMKRTRMSILLYIVAFVGAVPLLTILGYTGYTYLVIATLLAVAWLQSALKGFGSEPDDAWAKRVFRMSLVVLTALCIIISIEKVFP